MRSRRHITVCWLDGWASLALWDKGAGRVSKWEEIPSRECTPERYRRVLEELQHGDGSRRSMVTWVIIAETFPSAFGGDLKRGSSEAFHMPVWLERCWEYMPEQDLPDRVVSGTVALGAVLRQWAELRKPGCGIYFSLKDRGYFLGYGEENSYCRVSRPASTEYKPVCVLEEDWLQQTRMLYRNRTGYDLREILLPDGAHPAGSRSADDKVLIRGLNNLPLQADVPVPIGWHLFHNCGHVAGVPELEVRLLDKRRRIMRMDTVFRWCALLLLGGWAFLLLSACRMQGTVVPVDPTQEAIWIDACQQWSEHDRKWRVQCSREELLRMPYELVGIIASSAPDGVALERVHVRRSKVGGPDLRLVMEGNCEGQEATTAFRGWMEQLKDATPLSRIENLRFERAGHNLAFYLDASTEEGQP